MSGLLDEEALERVVSAWRRVLRSDPLLSRVAMPELKPFAAAFNDALTGEDEGRLNEACDSLVRANLDPSTVGRITTLLAETFTDEANTESRVVRRSLVSTLGYVCGLLMTTMVADIKELARRDFLTGLENRRAWDEALDQRLANRDDLALAMVDLDGLKAVNDSQGHDAGDAMLRKFAADLLSAVVEPGRVYRFGGDEYAVLLPHGRRDELELQLHQLSTKDGVVPFSFGVADTRGDGREAEQLEHVADDRMYNMKKEHKANIQE